MALNQQTHAEDRADAIALMRSESNFERSTITGQQCHKDATPRQGDLPDSAYLDLMETISYDDVSYVVFSDRTPIAWVHRNGAVTMPEIEIDVITSKHQKMVREAYGPDLINVRDMIAENRERAHEVAKGKSEAEAKVRQYADLTEDELISLAADLGSSVSASATALEGRSAALEMVAVVDALDRRRKATADSRARVGEYLRQQAIVEQKYRKDTAEGASDYAKRNAKAPQAILHEVRADEYAMTATLRLTDLQRLVPTSVRDSEAEFYSEQLTRLGQWDGDARITEKQAALLPCIAKGHIRSFGAGSYSGKDSGRRDACTCVRPDGRTIAALIKKGVIGGRKHLGYNSGATLMLKKFV